MEIGADGGPVVRVRSAPEAGKATAEAASVLATALRVPKTSVRLHAGRRTRTKTYDVEGLSAEELRVRLRAR